MEERRYAVAIDGPSGAGKSTIARSVAQALGFRYVDTGAIYRTVGCAALRWQADPGNPAAMATLLNAVQISITYGEDGLQRMALNGEDVTEEIRQPEISLYASRVAALPEVRAFLLEMQRDMARRHSVVMDGRDIGTVVLPEADVKIFLTAGVEERARRRYEELVRKGMPQPYERILNETRQRDNNDTHRAAAPLRPAEDAVTLDTTGLAFSESRQQVLAVIKERIRL